MANTDRKLPGSAQKHTHAHPHTPHRAPRVAGATPTPDGPSHRHTPIFWCVDTPAAHPTRAPQNTPRRRLLFITRPDTPRADTDTAWAAGVTPLASVPENTPQRALALPHFHWCHTARPRHYAEGESRGRRVRAGEGPLSPRPASGLEPGAGQSLLAALPRAGRGGRSGRPVHHVLPGNEREANANASANASAGRQPMPMPQPASHAPAHPCLARPSSLEEAAAGVVYGGACGPQGGQGGEPPRCGVVHARLPVLGRAAARGACAVVPLCVPRLVAAMRQGRAGREPACFSV